MPRVNLACAGAVACAAAMTPIDVPREISERTSLELSGITWSHVLSRYVMVSDDVTDGGQKHAPELFTLTPDGHLDRSPIQIKGASEVNDPESIAEGPEGTLFVCTSHSINKHGHLPESRRQLLHLALSSAHEAKILGRVDLTLARNADGSTPWGPGLLDIEAIGYRGGDLYVGLKSPLADDGSATIFRLENAAAVVDSGKLAPGALTRWATARFCVPASGTTVCEGIADLTFTTGDSVLIAANSPKGMPSDGGGALWKLAGRGGKPELLQRFKNEKPEGLALAPDGKSAIIVFDRDGRTPIWTTWQLTP